MFLSGEDQAQAAEWDWRSHGGCERSNAAAAALDKKQRNFDKVEFKIYMAVLLI